MSLCGPGDDWIHLGKDGRSAGTVQVGNGGRRRIRKQVLGDAHNKVADKLGDLQRLHRENRSTGVSARSSARCFAAGSTTVLRRLWSPRLLVRRCAPQSSKG